MKVLVACEFSGTVRDAFKAAGHDAWSCDLLPTETPGNHIQGDVLDVIGDPSWDLMIAHPPCTHLAASGVNWFTSGKKDWKLMDDALEFFLKLLNAPVPQIAVENPVGVVSSRIVRPDQIVQPYQFGDPEQKTTCLWLKGLPKLHPTSVVAPRFVHYPSGKRPAGQEVSSRKDRGHRRSIFFPGIAAAMASQWKQDHCWRSRTGCREPSRYVVRPRV